LIDEFGEEIVMKKYLIVIIFVIILSPTITWAASHCIRSGASGSTCADWGTNACNALPATLTRRNTYYIAKGSYAGRAFNTAASGISVITIQGATAADHGTDAGWSSSYSVDVNEGVDRQYGHLALLSAHHTGV
jgi:hypothetical protein